MIKMLHTLFALSFISVFHFGSSQCAPHYELAHVIHSVKHMVFNHPFPSLRTDMVSKAILFCLGYDGTVNNRGWSGPAQLDARACLAAQ